MLRVNLMLIIALVVTSNALVQSPPRIIKQPFGEEIFFKVASYGDLEKLFIIECEAEDEPASKYRWIKNGKHFDFTAHDDRITQPPGQGTLTFTEPRDEDAGQYQCFAENEYGIATSNSVFVRKSYFNNFEDEEINEQIAKEGEPFKLQCKAPEGLPKPRVYWIIQTSLGGIKTINNSRMTVDPEGNLWFSNVTRFDELDDDIYACAASSTFHNETKLGNRVLLKVTPSRFKRYPPIRQYVSSRNVVALRGQEIEIFCIYGGTPLPQTVWSKDGKPITWSDRVTQGNYGKTLVIKYPQKGDKGSYTCNVSNGAGQPQSSTFNLDIKSIPYFTVEPEIGVAAEEETIEIECEAKGIPEAAIKWIYNGKPIEESSPNPRRTVQKNKIIIRRLEKKDTGNYGCNATNDLGYVYKDVYVNILELPSEGVQSLQAYPMGSSAFWLTWKKPLNPNGKLQGYRIYYEVVKGSELEARQEREPRITDPTKTSAKLTGLQADTKYRIHVVGYTKAGDGDDYYIEAFTNENITASVKPDQPTFYSEIIETYGNPKAKIFWKPNLNGNPGSHFFVRYRKKGEPNLKNSPPVIDGDFDEIFLECDNLYEVQVVSVDGIYETSSASEIITANEACIKDEETPYVEIIIASLIIIFIIILVLFAWFKRKSSNLREIIKLELELELYEL